EYDVRSGQWKVLEPLLDPPLAHGVRAAPRKYVTGVRWLTPGEELLVTHNVDGTPGEGTVYTFTSSGVASRPVDASFDGPQSSSQSALQGLSVELRQNVKEAPKVGASDGSREMNVLPPEPALQGVTLGRSRALQRAESVG